MPPQLHTDFVEVRVHTAKCDSCEKHNKLTLYRCTECGQHVCSPCWNKTPGDRTHLFRGGSGDVPQLNANDVVEDDETDSERDNENQRRPHARRRVHVISDDEDDDFPVLRPAPTITNADTDNSGKEHHKERNVNIFHDCHGDHEDDLTSSPPTITNADTNNSSKEHRKRKNVNMDHDHHGDHEDDLPRPSSTITNADTNNSGKGHRKKKNVNMSHDHCDDHEDDLPRSGPNVPARRLPVLRPAVPAANTNANGDVNRVTQRVSHFHPEHSEVDRHRMVQAYNSTERQAAPTQYIFIDEQQPTHQARHPSQSLISYQQGTHSAPLRPQPAVYRPRPGADVDRQAARNQWAFASSRPPNPQDPRPAQPSIAYQQATHLVPNQIQPAIYRPRPGADVDRQAARNQLAFADNQRSNHQAPRPAQAFISQQHAQTAAHMDQVSAHNQQAFRLNQQTQAYLKAMRMEARNRQALSSYENARQAADRNQIASHNQQAFVSNQQWSSAADYMERMMAARDRQQAYLSQQPANRPNHSPAQSSVSDRRSIEISPLPAQAFLPHQHAASLASRQDQHQTTIGRRPNRPSQAALQEHSPEVLEAADALLFYAGAEQVPGVRFRSNQDSNGVSQLLGAAGQVEKTSSATSESRSSLKTLVGGSEAGATQSFSPRGSASNSRPSTDADPAEARLDKHRARLAGLHSPAGTRNTASDPPASLRGHQSHRHVAKKPDAGVALAKSSAAQSHGSNSRGARSDPGSMLPMSVHAATYINQWNAGRAAKSSRSSSTAADVSTTQSDHPRSSFPALRPSSATSVPDLTGSGSEPGEAVEASSHALNDPISTLRDPNDVDVMMGDANAKILENDESCASEAGTPQDNSQAAEKDAGVEKAHARGTEPITEPGAEGRSEKHQRSEKNGGLQASKEQKASADVDVVDARKRNGKEKDSERIDGDLSDVEITSWTKTSDENKTTEKQPGTTAGEKGPDSSKTLKKGVAQVKKPERKGQKDKKSARIAG